MPILITEKDITRDIAARIRIVVEDKSLKKGTIRRELSNALGHEVKHSQRKTENN